MNETLLLGVAFFVFMMMGVGLVLTMLEFKHGAPRKQQDEAEARFQDKKD